MFQGGNNLQLFPNLTSKLSLFLTTGLALMGKASAVDIVGFAAAVAAASATFFCSPSLLVFLRMVAVSKGGRGGRTGLWLNSNLFHYNTEHCAGFTQLR